MRGVWLYVGLGYQEDFQFAHCITYVKHGGLKSEENSKIIKGSVLCLGENPFSNVKSRFIFNHFSKDFFWKTHFILKR